MIRIIQTHTIPAFDDGDVFCVVNDGIFVEPQGKIVFPESLDVSDVSETALALLRFLFSYRNSDIEMTEAELSFGVLTEEKIYKAQDLQDEIDRIKAEGERAGSENTNDGKRHTSVLDLYRSLLRQSDGIITEEIKSLLRTSAARSLIRKAFADGRISNFIPDDDDCAEYEYLCHVWKALRELQQKGILIRVESNEK